MAAAVVVAVLSSQLACRGHPLAFSVSLVEQRLDQNLIRALEPMLLGKPIESADAVMFDRNDTLVNVEGGRPISVIYPSPRNPTGEIFLVADLDEQGLVRGLSTWKRNRDGLWDAIRARRFTNQVFTLSREEVELKLGLKPAVASFRSLRSGFLVHMYRMPGFEFWAGEKYILACFNDQGSCQEVRLVGLVARGEGAGPTLARPEANLAASTP